MSKFSRTKMSNIILQQKITNILETILNIPMKYEQIKIFMAFESLLNFPVCHRKCQLRYLVFVVATYTPRSKFLALNQTTIGNSDDLQYCSLSCILQKNSY